MQPANVNVLVMKALLEQATINPKDRNKTAEQRNLAFDFCKLAHLMDPQNALALNLMANHCFQTSKIVVFGAGCCILDKRHVLTIKESLTGIRVDDLVSFGSSDTNEFDVEFRISAILNDFKLSSFGAIALAVVESVGGATIDDFVILELTCDIPEHVGKSSVSLLKCRELGKASEYARQALSLSASSTVRADSHFLMGKIAHIRGDNSEAFDCYRRALKESSDLILAAFGAAQILLSRAEFAGALELFEKVLLKCPDDKDTQAYVVLLKALHKSIITPLDKLREIAPGFRFEIDLWLLQGQLRQKLPSEHASALRCYLLAKDCIEQFKGQTVPAAVMSNIAVLYQSMGKMNKALEFSRLALTSIGVQKKTDRSVAMGSIHINSDFENIFFCWSQLELCFLWQTDQNSEHFSLAKCSDSMDLTQHLFPGDEVVIRDVRFTIKEVSVKDILCYRPPVRLASHSSGGVAEEHPLFTRKIFDNFNDETLTYCYNLARVLEDLGRTKSASEVYVELLKRHPSFIECEFDEGIFTFSADFTHRLSAIEPDLL
jgi:tetratricopeptide (TPR) repeat protein